MRIWLFPIVFTSANAIPAPGDWGGLILLGNAPVNVAPTVNVQTLNPAKGAAFLAGGHPAHAAGHGGLRAA